MTQSGIGAELIVGSRNPAKVAQLRRLVEPLGISVAPLGPEIAKPDRQFAEFAAIEEAATIEAIAAAKARYWSRQVGARQTVIVSDGGLLISALGDAWDPTRTRRFAGEETEIDDLRRATALLRLTETLRGSDRAIGWREAVAVARDGRVVAVFTAESCPGLLATEVDSSDVDVAEGFWIEAVWCCPEYSGRRLARLSAAERASRDNHWQRLGVMMRQWLLAPGDAPTVETIALPPGRRRPADSSRR